MGHAFVGYISRIDPSKLVEAGIEAGRQLERRRAGGKQPIAVPQGNQRKVKIPQGEFLTAEQLAEVSPWTEGAIDRMRSRGRFKKGVHWFQFGGPRSQILYHWPAIKRLITGEPEPAPAGTVRLANGKEVRIDAEEERQVARLLR